MIKKFALALSVSTICGNIQPAYAAQDREALAIDRGRITVKRMAAKRITRTERLADRRKALAAKRTARIENLRERRKALVAKRTARAASLLEHRKMRRLAQIKAVQQRAEKLKLQKMKRTARTTNRMVERQE